MSKPHPIQWLNMPGLQGETWNPTTGCSPVSPGCQNCYARELHEKRHKAWLDGWAYAPIQYHEQFGTIIHHTDRMDVPLHWRRPRMVFVDSMGDLLHKHVAECYVYKVLSIAAQCPQHIFVILTKRADRMLELLGDQYAANSVWVRTSTGLTDVEPVWPLPNVWLGVSAEDQQRAEERIPLLLQTPAAVRFVSVEPMLGPVDLTHYLACPECGLRHYRPEPDPYVDWVICGGEKCSLSEARMMEREWAHDLHRQCKTAGVPFFFKQWGTMAVAAGEFITMPVQQWPEVK